MILTLNQNLYTEFDDEDKELVASRKWYAVKQKTFYVASYQPGNKPLLKLHRFLLGVTDPKIFVDHINHNTLDNRRCNLRICTPQQNNMNAKKTKGLWPFKGVAFDSRKNYWYARIRHNNHLYHLGTFYKIEDAARAYNVKAIELFGEFACVNRL